MPVPALKLDSITKELTEGGLTPFRVRGIIKDLEAISRSGHDALLSGRAHSLMGWAYALLGNELKSREHHRIALGLDRNSQMAPNNYGVSLQSFGHHDEALAQFAEAASRPDGYHPMVLGNLAVALANLGEQAKAIEVLEAAVAAADQREPYALARLAGNAAAIGVRRACVELIARSFAAETKVALGDATALEVLARAPQDWLSRLPFILRRAIAAELQAIDLKALQQKIDAAPVVNSSELAPEVEQSHDEAFEATQNWRRGATAERLPPNEQ